MEKKLPKNWVETDLDNVIQRMSNGSALQQFEEPFENSFPISRIETIWNETIDLNRVKYVKPTEADIEKYSFFKGDVLFSHINSDKHLGKTAVFNLDSILIHGINLLLLRSKPQFNGYLLNYFLRYCRLTGKFIEVAQRSVNQSSINQKKLNTFKIPLPPVPEQQRIVAKLDMLFTQLETIKTSMANIPLLLNDFRKQLITQAVTGKLTNCVVKEKRLGDFLTDVKYGTSMKSEYEIDGTPIFRIPNINDGEINDIDLKYSILNDKEYNQLKLVEGDVLIIRSNGSISLVGRSAIIREKHIGYAYAGYLIRLRCGEELNPEFLNYSLESDFLRTQIVSTSHSSSGVNNINSQEIKDLKLYWTLPKEQKKIVSLVENLLAKANAIEQQYKSLKEKIDTLPQALLHKAFKGELIPQLDSDGNARNLLDEIMALKNVVVKKVKKN